ncbi:S41 family peptidase [Candidatus Uhrbacteria bacterium]|nr:S41 family peptidase [Candidatus Uhrbacteria bacterium]
MSINDIVPQSKDTPRFPYVTWIVIFGIAVGGSFYGGYLMGGKGVSLPVQAPLGQEKEGIVKNFERPAPSYLNKDVDFNLFWDVWKRVKSEYISKDTSDTQLFYGSLRGIVSALDDPYSEFFDPDLAKQFDESLSGSFEGIGAEIGMKNKQLIIVAPLAGTPAEKAGLKAGDHILAVDKKSTVDMSIDMAVSNIRGKGGTKVTLTIYRIGDKEAHDVTITRQKIVVPSVVWELKPESIGYIKISHFNQDTQDRFADAVREVLSKNPKGLVIDLRNNPGGYLDTAVRIASYWVEGKTIVIEKYDGERSEEYRARGRASLKNLKTVVVVNEGSASASEIVAGALQDYGKATLVGKKTFGKGSVQTLQKLEDGSALKLTIATWLTPKGRSINQEGITPDITVEPAKGEVLADKEKDVQLEKALELLK